MAGRALDEHALYEAVLDHARVTSTIATCDALLGWDEQTYLPRGGSDYRGKQHALLAGLVHDRATDPWLGESLDRLAGSSLTADPGSPESAVVRELKRRFDRQTKLPKRLVESIAEATTRGQQTWVEARAKSDFSRFAPSLTEIVTLKREEASCVGIGPTPYDALLDEYEPDARSSDLAKLFETLRSELVPLSALVRDASRQPDRTILARSFPIDRQRILAEMAAEAIGFDFERGRLDVSAHPFCSGIAPGDCRITTRFDEHDFSEAFFGVLHEVGHGLYEQGLPDAAFGTPLGEAVSLGVHESQSRLWENGVGRGRAFWEHWFPTARRIFRESLHGVTLDDFVFAVNRVEPSLIRTQADEVTYNLHVLIRFDLERAILSGDLAVADVPAAWNEAYRTVLGVTPATDAEGCLQDVHWAAGLFGYFPTYSLGNVYAAMLLDAARRDLGDLDAMFAQGEFSPLRDWLRLNVHQHGQRYVPTDLIAKATGSAPDPTPLVRSLWGKYGALYGIEREF
jgi:carboxypeptidase Taq